MADKVYQTYLDALQSAVQLGFNYGEVNSAKSNQVFRVILNLLTTQNDLKHLKFRVLTKKSPVSVEFIGTRL